MMTLTIALAVICAACKLSKHWLAIAIRYQCATQLIKFLTSSYCHIALYCLNMASRYEYTYFASVIGHHKHLAKAAACLMWAVNSASADCTLEI